MDARVVGILSGISYVSGLDYYGGINKQYGALRGKGRLMAPNPLIVLASVDCDEYADLLVKNQWDAVAEYLATAVERLVLAKCDFLGIASNTGHIAVPEIRKRFPKLPILHIADCTAAAIKAKGFTTVGLLGTEPTMRENYLKDQLRKHGIRVLTPESDDDLSQIFQFIMQELGHNILKPATRDFFLGQIRKLAARGAEGVILGCTEIELLVKQADIATVPLFRSAELHIEAIAHVQARLKTIDDYLPTHTGVYVAELEAANDDLTQQNATLHAELAALKAAKAEPAAEAHVIHYEMLGLTIETVHDAIKEHAEGPIPGSPTNAFVTWLKKNTRKVSAEDERQIAELPKDLTPAKVLSIMKEINNQNAIEIVAALETLKKRHKVTSMAKFQRKITRDPKLSEEFELLIEKCNHEAQEKVLRANGINRNVLDEAMKSYQDDMNFMRAIMKCQETMQERLMAMWD